MNKIQFATLLVRLSGFQFVVVGLNYLTYLPERMVMASHTSLPLSAQTAQVETKMLLARCLLHVTLGAALWLFAPRAAQIFTAGLESEKENTRP